MTYNNYNHTTTDIIQWNCRGLSANLEELDILISSLNPTIICLKEIFLNNKVNINLPGYSSIHFIKGNTGRASGGTSIFIKDLTPHSKITIQSDLQLTCCMVTLHRAITICNIYIPPSYSLKTKDLDNIISQFPKPFILLGDFNAHNHLWGSTNITSRGRLIENFINHHNLSLLNDGSPTYLHPATGSLTNIDLAICDPSLSIDFSNWKVHSSLCGSDHFPILISSPPSALRDFAPNWCFPRADWVLFSDLCSSNISNTILHAQDEVESFTKTLLDNANRAIPLNFHSTKPYKPWFNSDCKKATSLKNKALRTFKTNPTSHNLDNFRILRAKARRTIKQSKRLSWTHYVSTLDSKSSPAKVWKMVHNFKGKDSSKKSISHLTINNKKITDPKDICNEIAHTLAKISSDQNLNPLFQTIKTIGPRKTF